MKKQILENTISHMMVAVSQRDLVRLSQLNMAFEGLSNPLEFHRDYELKLDLIRQSCMYALKPEEDYNKWFADAQERYKELNLEIER